MTGSYLSKIDQNNAYAIRWGANKIIELSQDHICRDYAEDIIDLVSDILNTDDVHIDNVIGDKNYIKSPKELEVESREYIHQPVSGKVAIVIGHNENTGARSHNNDDEWDSLPFEADMFAVEFFVTSI